MATLQDTLNNITATIAQGFEVFVQNEVTAAVAPPTAQQVPVAQPLPVKSTVQQVAQYAPYLLAGVVALILLRR